VNQNVCHDSLEFREKVTLKNYRLSPTQVLSLGMIPMRHSLGRWTAHMTCSAPPDWKVPWNGGTAPLSGSQSITSPSFFIKWFGLTALVFTSGYPLSTMRVLASFKQPDVSRWLRNRLV
jgi:hypothetical protein